MPSPRSISGFPCKAFKARSGYLTSAGFTARDGELKLLPNASGAVGAAVLGLGQGAIVWRWRILRAASAGSIASPRCLPNRGANGALAWLLGTYHFTRYRKAKASGAKLVLPKASTAMKSRASRQGRLPARDLINTPPNDMGPEELANAARDLAKSTARSSLRSSATRLLKENYPLIHAVGRGSARAPRLAGFSWGRPGAPESHAGRKGVVFDTGGYDLKRRRHGSMRKDMGGAATVLAIADMVMGAKLDVRLRVLISPGRELGVGNRLRPSDVFASRKGLTVEIGNTTRRAASCSPTRFAKPTVSRRALIDIATLTARARTATGFECRLSLRTTRRSRPSSCATPPCRTIRCGACLCGAL